MFFSIAIGYDLWPIFTLKQRHSKLRKLLEPGTSWIHGKKHIDKAGFKVLISSETENLKEVLLQTRSSMLELQFFHIAFVIFPAEDVVPIFRKQIEKRWAQIYIDDAGNIERVD